MKKTIMYILILLVLIISISLIIPKKTVKKDLKTIRLGEVTHSVFYAPLYVALENGYFEEEGLNIELSLISGANNVTAAVLSGDIDVGFCGPEATIYIYDGGEKDYLVSFAGLTKRDGQFILSRKKIENFDYSMLIGKEVLAGRTAGMPELNFENALKNENIAVKDVNINTSVDFANLTSAFISGTGDFVNLFEPNATKLEQQGFGYVVGSIGQKSGEMPYTAFNTKKSYLEKNKDTIISFTNAIAKGLNFTESNDAKTIANIISDQFPDTSLNDLVTIVERYKSNDSWLTTPYIEKELFNNLEDLLIYSKQIDNYVPYNELIVNTYKK